MMHLILLKIVNMMSMKEVLLQRFMHFCIKKTSGSNIKNENMSNKELAKGLHKPVTRNF